MIVELSELSVVLLPDGLTLKSNNECINYRFTGIIFLCIHSSH